jgi:FkbM family methyltransferase
VGNIKVSRMITSSTSNLIFDVGMNNGDDTGFYLECGFQVVAIEANDAFCRQVAARFPDAVREGRLTILNVAVAGEPGEVEFWINEDHPEWSALDVASAARGGHRHRKVTVPAVRFSDLLQRYGVPHYLKVDIESADHFCLDGLRDVGLPDYLSVEVSDVALVDACQALGYRRFMLVEQSSLLPINDWSGPMGWTDQWARILTAHRAWPFRLIRKLVGYPRVRAMGQRSKRFPDRDFPIGSSGDFGSNLTGRWITANEVKSLWHRHYQHWSSHGREFWCDLHASRE